MNERIRELKDKIWTEEYWDNPNTDKLLPAQLNKFAELIVRECAEVIIGNEIDHPITGAVYDGDQAKAIKEHFGVEE